MLDIKFIRENSDLVREAARKKHIALDLERLLALDDKRRALIASVDEMRRIHKAQSEQTATLHGSEREVLIRELHGAKDALSHKEFELRTVESEFEEAMLAVPNIPDPSVPEGASDAENQEIKTWGQKSELPFNPKGHIELMEKLNMIDLNRGSKVAGFRGYFLINDGALLSFSIWHYALAFFLKKQFIPMIAPSLVRPENLFGTGYLPQGEEDLYKTQDNEYLAGTAEVATMGYYRDEILEQSQLPIKFLSFSPCFRREAGSHGKDVKGLIRVHEFFKLEQVVFCEARHEDSVKFHEWLNRNTEEFIESLAIPYRTVANCGGDLGLGQVKKYDIELWVPIENSYREISSASYFHDFQTRRLNIKYRDEAGKLRFVHSLNSTAIPTPRILVSLVENFQQPDGSIRIPKALQPYMGKEKII
ncbi:MAG TPA: serine--tRNA ligase [Candidatus Paceibacterota bacterium]